MVKEIRFTKMHGAGNDYIYIDLTRPDATLPADFPSLARRISHRHCGVGADGLVAIMRPADPSRADFAMRMWNADGSEAQMCGNASRCVAKYIHDHSLSASRSLRLETRAGIKLLTITALDPHGRVSEVSVDMGPATFSSHEVPVSLPSPTPTHGIPDHHTPPLLPGTLQVSALGRSFCIHPVGMGNPHGVILLDHDPTDEEVLGAGPLLERDPAWPERANIEFAHIIDRSHINMRVWERGSGETMACGTGACATAAAAIALGLTDAAVELQLPGGTLCVSRDPATGHMHLRGPAATICTGVFPL